MPLEYKSLPIDTGILDPSGYEIVTPERSIEEIENIKKLRVISENLLKRRILDIPLLQEIEKIIKEKQYFKDYLIDEYYIVYNVIKRTQLIAGTRDKYELQPRHSHKYASNNNVFNLAGNVINTIIEQTKIPDKKYICDMFQTGDSWSIVYRKDFVRDMLHDIAKYKILGGFSDTAIMSYALKKVSPICKYKAYSVPPSIGSLLIHDNAQEVSSLQNSPIISNIEK
jgi:hypothetical protein